MTDLKELRDRVAKLTGLPGLGSTEVNFLVEAWRLGGVTERWQMNSSDFRIVKDGHVLAYSAPDYVSSADLVMALIDRVLPGCWWQLNRTRDGKAYHAGLRRDSVGGDPTNPFDVWTDSKCCPTPALALLLALLEASSSPSTEETTHHG